MENERSPDAVWEAGLGLEYLCVIVCEIKTEEVRKKEHCDLFLDRCNERIGQTRRRRRTS